MRGTVNKLGFGLLVLILLLAVSFSAYAYTFKKNDFEITISKISPSRDYYLPGDKISAEYEFKPADSDVAENLVQKLFTVWTDMLVDNVFNNFQIGVNYVGGGYTSFPSSESEISYKNDRTIVKFEFPKVQGGISRVKIELEGTVPKVSGRWVKLDVLNFTISGGEKGVLEPLTIYVLNKDKFNSDMDSVEKKLEDIKDEISSLKDKGYDVGDLEDLYSQMENNFEKAKDYFDSRDYSKADEYLTKVENGFEEYKVKKDETLVGDRYGKLMDRLDEINTILENVDTNITVLYREGKIDNVIYTQLYKDYDNLLEKLNDLQKQLEDVKKNYIDEGKYKDASDELDKISDKIDDLQKDVNTLNTRVNSYFAEEKKGGGFDMGQFFSSYGIYILAILLIILLAVVAILIVRGREGKWDELR